MMATSTKIVISPENTGLWGIKQTEDAARKASELMQRDLQDHHVYLNHLRFHDHMPHHILALYGTGASVQQLEDSYNLRDFLQRHVQSSHDDVIAKLDASWDNAVHYLGKEEYYPDFLIYFQKQIDALGYPTVVNEYLFKGNERADDLLVRLHAGVVHPLIQLMFGLEWKQPAVIAEALAQTCVHELEGLDKLLLPSERSAPAVATGAKMPTLLSMYESIGENPLLANAAHGNDGTKVRGGVLSRALEPMLEVLQKVHVDHDELDERTAEMLHTIVFVSSSAAIHPPHHAKYDFFLMHHVNSALIYITINKEDWIPIETKIRMLEWKVRMDLFQYAAQGAPVLSLDHIASYVPKTEFKIDQSVREIGKRLLSFGDDGHGIKQARATTIGHELMKQYANRPWVILSDDRIWKTIQHMVVDSLEGPGVLYVRGAGLHKVWEDVSLQSAPRRNSESLQGLQTGSGSSEEALKGLDP